MNLTDIIAKWLNEKWSLYMERNNLGHLHAFIRVRGGSTFERYTSPHDGLVFVLTVVDDYIVLADHKYAKCICCATKRKIKAVDPELFNLIETEINAWQKSV